MTDIDSDIRYTQWPDTAEDNERMARWIVGSGGRLYATALYETHIDANDGMRRCVRCGRIHPCQTRRCAERALAILDRQDQQHLGQHPTRHSR